jgi:hypothetical protein
MGNTLLSVFIAAGIAAFAYSKLGRRLGYGNSRNVWTMVIVSFALSFLVMMVLLNTLVSLD